jgi:hypothetical protein
MMAVGSFFLIFIQHLYPKYGVQCERHHTLGVAAGVVAISDWTQGREKYKSNYASCSGQISSVKTIRHKSSALINSARPKNHESTCLLLRCVMSYWSKCAGKQEYIKSSLF